MAKDLFSVQSSLYAKYRPGYPADLIDHILDFTEGRDKAWDCATGNGQAAVLYADRFKSVYATDISEKQLNQATRLPNIFYSVSQAEKTVFPDNSFDLITVAQAYHWLDFEDFHKEATRVGKSGAVVVWGYGLFQAEEHPRLNELIRQFYIDIVGPYWDPERKRVDESYRTVPFAFERLPVKDFWIRVEYDYDELIGYFHTWSSVQHYIRELNADPVARIAEAIRVIWGASQKKQEFSFPLFLLLGRIAK